MPKRSSKDLNQAAFNIVQQSTGQSPNDVQASAPTVQTPVQEKNPAAVALGRLGGLKGGKARAAALSGKKRSEIAKQAAEKRWQLAKKYIAKQKL